MQQLSGIFFDMDTGYANSLHLSVYHNVQITLSAKRYFCLRNLVCLRQIRIEVILSVLFANTVDLAVHSMSHFDCIFYHFFIQCRQCTRHAHADRANLCVDFQTKCVTAVAVNFRFGIQFCVDFQSNDNFIIFH